MQMGKNHLVCSIINSWVTVNNRVFRNLNIWCCLRHCWNARAKESIIIIHEVFVLNFLLRCSCVWVFYFFKFNNFFDLSWINISKFLNTQRRVVFINNNVIVNSTIYIPFSKHLVWFFTEFKKINNLLKLRVNQAF